MIEHFNLFNALKKFIDLFKEKQRFNVYFKNKILICLDYDNIAHLIGIQYFQKIFKLSKRNSIHKNMHIFIDKVINEKIDLYHLKQKFINNINLLNENKFSPAYFFDLIYARLEYFYFFLIESFIKDKEFIVLENKDKINQKMLLIKLKNKNGYFLILENISLVHYKYETYKPISIQKWNTKQLINETKWLTKKTEWKKNEKLT
ncbi:hypothetical protein [Mycoplasmopsis gallinarum]|uniref:Uncharacterized protein n=1 Tax=Mycoplasmopsis gallinarum TaxID=29557 RepID=A0A168RJT7_9BACT|nr:hypothetical protein [Mycoplasmopsis gallinarum]OAB49049.1 hypothetical protein MGALLINA_00840 [Mycoplasmopsis gallinarum]